MDSSYHHLLPVPSVSAMQASFTNHYNVSSLDDTIHIAITENRAGAVLSGKILTWGKENANYGTLGHGTAYTS